MIDGWTWWNYGPFLGAAVVLFLAGASCSRRQAWKPASPSSTTSIRTGKLSLLFVAAYQLFWVYGNAMWDGWLNIAVWYNVVLTIPLLLAYRARTRETAERGRRPVLHRPGVRAGLHLVDSGRPQLALAQ